MIDMQPVLEADTRNEVGTSESPAIVAHLGLDVDSSRRALPLIGGKTAGIPLERLNGVDVQPRC